MGNMSHAELMTRLTGVCDLQLWVQYCQLYQRVGILGTCITCFNYSHFENCNYM